MSVGWSRKSSVPKVLKSGTSIRSLVGIFLWGIWRQSAQYFSEKWRWRAGWRGW
jgi:hypothetical protein